MTNKVLKSVHTKSPVTLPRVVSSGWASTWVDWKATGLWRSRDRISHMQSYLLLITWTIVHQITDTFELWCWKRLLRVPWTAKWSNQSILKEIYLEYSGRTDAKAPILWPPNEKSWLIWKDLDAGKDWRQEEKGTTDEMVGWHHWLNGYESEQTPGYCEEEGSLACCTLWGHKESDTT